MTDRVRQDARNLPRLCWGTAKVAHPFPVVALAFLVCAATTFAAPPMHGMVASVHERATQAGVATLKSGGNAVDAAVAVALTLGVVDGADAGIGGGCFMLIRRPNGSFVVLDGRETAPAKATRNMFIRNGKADTRLSQTGALASGVPGAVAVYEYAVQHFGRKQFRDLLEPAADLAEKGFAINAGYASRLKSVADDMAQFEAARAIFFKNGEPLAAGETLKQPDLARSYRAIAAEGSSWFYRGDFARAAEKWMQANAGLITWSDFASYRIAQRESLRTTYRDFEIVGFPPPSSGGVHVAEILNILENFDLQAMKEADRLHVIGEAMRLAFADRAYWLGDPDFAKVPRGLFDKKYAAGLAKRISLDHAASVETHGMPPDWQHDVFKKHTTHFSVADAEGNWVACTATVNTSFGSKVVIPGTGVIMNNQMDDFSIEPGVKNYFGLIGGEANAVGPRKRPLSSMSPTIVLKDGKPIIALGAAGGPKIISQVAFELVQMLDLNKSASDAVAEPRIHQQWIPDELMVERTLPQPLREALQQKGHKVVVESGMGVSQIVRRLPSGEFVGAADPRGGGVAAGW
jgi:gamma-glutamyltranspeptidase / glutathione hydrolase